MRGSFKLLLVAVILGVGLAEEEEGPVFVKAQMGKDRTLTCKGSEEGTLRWSVTMDNAENDTKTVVEGEKYEMEGKSLVVKDVQEEDLGVYRCYEEDEEVAAFLLDISVRLKEFPPSFSIDEGSSTDPEKNLKCEVFTADQEIEFKWFSRPEDAEDDCKDCEEEVCAQTDDNDCSIPVAQPLFEKKDSNAPVVPLPSRTTITRGTNEEGIPWSSLQIKDSDKTDRRVFICQASVVGTDPNPEDCKESKSKHCDRTETILRVKDPLAAVWPFCGIVVEVILLCVIIFFCEKKKTASEKEDYDEGSNGNNMGSGHQRK
jgi:hypothetical protein